MAGLEVEVRCYKHVQEYTLAELSAALEHLESQAAAGRGMGSWSQDQLDALRSEVARKRAAEALTQLGDRALEALARKVHSYSASSADHSPFAQQRGLLQHGASGSRDASLLEAALESAAAGAPAAGARGGGGNAAAGALYDGSAGSRRVSSPDVLRWVGGAKLGLGTGRGQQTVQGQARVVLTVGCDMLTFSQRGVGCMYSLGTPSHPVVIDV